MVRRVSQNDVHTRSQYSDDDVERQKLNTMPLITSLDTVRMRPLTSTCTGCYNNAVVMRAGGATEMKKTTSRVWSHMPMPLEGLRMWRAPVMSTLDARIRA